MQRGRDKGFYRGTVHALGCKRSVVVDLGHGLEELLTSYQGGLAGLAPVSR